MAKIDKSVTAEFNFPFTKRDLQELLNELRDVPNNAQITVNYHSGDQRERGYCIFRVVIPSTPPTPARYDA